MLYSERERLRALEEREAVGESVWTRELSEAARRKLWYALRGAVRRDLVGGFFEAIQGLVSRALGLPPYLHVNGSFVDDDIEGALLHEDRDLVLSVVEAAARVLRVNPYKHDPRGQGFEPRVNEIFRSHRCSYELVDLEIVPFESQELHTGIVGPVLRLLSGREGWQAVEEAYQKALKEIGDDPADAITDAGTALQQALVTRGCDGNALGPLIRDAKRKGVLAPHDPTLAGGIAKLMDWVSADRSETGDAHEVTGAQPEDAWLAVHVAGALILRLASGGGRGDFEY